MRRLDIEKLAKILVQPASRKSQTKIFDEKMNELTDIDRFELRFDEHWCDALIWIWVTDDKGQLVITQENGEKRIKALKKRVQFDFLAVA